MASNPDPEVRRQAEHLLRIFEAASEKPRVEFRAHSKAVSRAIFSPDGKQVLSWGEDGKLRLWDAKDGKQVGDFDGQWQAIRTASFSCDGRKVLSGDLATVRLWDADSQEELQRFQVGGRVAQVIFSPGGQIRAACDQTGLWLWNLGTGRDVHHYCDAWNDPLDVAYSQDGRRCVCADNHCKVRIWDLQTNRVLVRMKRPDDVVLRVAFSRDARYVLSCSAGGDVRLWDSRTGELLRKFEDDGMASCVGFSPDGQWAVSGYGGGPYLAVWEVATGRQVRRLYGQRSCAQSVAFSSDGRRVICGAEDGFVRIWNLPDD
jgi:WD40 repeat protein